MHGPQIKILLTFSFFLLRLQTIADSRPADEQGLVRHRRDDAVIPTNDVAHLGSLKADEDGILNEKCIPLYDCAEILESGYTESGLYRIDPGGRGDFTVFCDMNLLSGGWTVIQRRVDGKINFDRDWRSYRNGFGAFDSNFWLGLNKIKRITDMKTYELYIGLEDHYNDAADTAWARYGSFSLGSEEDHYKLYLSGYDETSPAGDSLDTHNGQSFSTVDEDNDLQCAQTHKGGWWYKDCIDSNLNGVWYADGTIVSSEQDGIIWQHWTTEDYSLKTTVMAIRAI